MEPIYVQAPPTSSFNKNRAPSDLLVGQLKHFQHVEHKSGISIDAAMARDIHSEAGAARYILAVTRAIKAQSALRPVGIAVVPSSKPVDRTIAPDASKGLAIAAGAEASAASLEKPAAGKKQTKRQKRKKS